MIRPQYHMCLGEQLARGLLAEDIAHARRRDQEARVRLAWQTVTQIHTHHHISGIRI
jgi:hypothetical protein